MLLKSDNISWQKTLQNSNNFVQWLVVNTLYQEMKKHHNQKDGSKGTPKLSPYWKLQPVTCTVKYGVEIRIMSVSEDNAHSWVEISHGLNKLFTNLNNNEQETSDVQFEEYALRLNAKDFACRPKAKAEPQRREPAGSSPRIVPMERRNWIDFELGKHSLRVRHFEESNSSSSSLTERRRWSGSFVENQGKSSESIPTIYSLVWR